MKLFDKYRLNQANDEERNAMTEQLILNKIEREKRKAYAEKLATEYGIKRTPPANIYSIWSSKWVVGIAASLLVGVLAWQFIVPASENYIQLTDNYLAQQYPNNERRKAGEDFAIIKSEAITAYNEKAYKEAAQLRSQLVQEGKASEYDYFFLALSYLYQQPAQADKAIAALQQALALPQKELHDETEWYLALAYLKANQLDKAKPLLENLINTGEWNSDKAERLLQAIKDNH